MQSPQKHILSLGASHLTILTYSDAAGCLVLDTVVHQPLNGDPDLKDQWLKSVESGLGQLEIKTSLKGITGIVLPGWAVLTKLLKVVRIEGEGQREVVRFEAENALPNGLAEFDWTYSIIHDDGVERDVLVQAVSRSFLSELLEILASKGIKPARIDSLISAELSAFQYQYGEEEGASVLLDVGARSVFLVAMSQQDLPFIRSLNFGGSSVSQALGSHLGKPFSESERLKLEWIQTQTDPADVEILNQSSEGFVNRLVNEVQRSLALYRRQGQSGNPARILLTGGASQLPGLADFLERKTGISTKTYDPFRKVSSGASLQQTRVSRVNYTLPAPIGMALAASDPKSEQGNLLPAVLSSQLEISEKKPWFQAAAIFILLAGVVVGSKFHFQALDLQRRISLVEAELAPMESLLNEVKIAYEEYERFSSAIQVKQNMMDRRQSRVAFLSDMQERLNRVQDVWLESFQLDREDAEEPGLRLRVTGSLLDRENPLSLVSSNSRSRVEDLLSSFQNSPFVQTIEDRRFDTSRPGILRFDFFVILNPNSVL